MSVMVKIDFKEGLYVRLSTDGTQVEVIHIELGTVHGTPAVRATGLNNEGQEVTKITSIYNSEILLLAKLIKESEYLGEIGENEE